MRSTSTTSCSMNLSRTKEAFSKAYLRYLSTIRKCVTIWQEDYGNRKRIRKREEFLDIMEEIIPWEEWVEFVRPFYPSGKRGRPVKGIETMLRMYLLQNWFNLSDEGVEDAIYDSYAFRKFMKTDFVNEQVPDATTLLKFRHMIEENHIGEVFFDAIKRVMDATGHISNIEYRINRRPKSLPKVSDNAIDWERYIEYRKSAVRCKIEHAFKIIKDTFGFRKVRYRGIAKKFKQIEYSVRVCKSAYGEMCPKRFSSRQGTSLPFLG